MPDVKVRNLTGGALQLPTLYLTDPIPANSSATFYVPDTDEFRGDQRIADLETAGTILVLATAGDALDRPLQVYTATTLPAANTVTAGTLIFNSTDRALYESDGTSWSKPIDGSAALLTAGATDIPAWRFVGLNTSAALVASPAAGERPVGVTAEAITGTASGRVQTADVVEVMPSSAIAADDELIAAPGGLAAPFQAAAVALGATVAGADASDDIDQTNLPATVSVTCGGNETGNTVIVYGDVGGNYTKETITLGAAGTFTSINTFAAVYCLETTATSVGTVDIRDGGLVGLLIPQITGTTAARAYGAIVPGTTTDSEGQHVQVRAGGANTANVVLFGTDFAGVEQAEVVTLASNTWVEGTLAFRTLTRVMIGADGIVWNLGATSQYDQQVEANERNEIRAYALEAEAVAGATVKALVLTQNRGIVAATAPLPYHVSQVSYGGGGTSTTATVYGVAATDVIQATLNAATNAANVIRAERTAADTVTITFDIDPGASTLVGLTVTRP